MRADGRSSEPRQSFALATLDRGPTEPVGEFSYSNAGYIIAGAALERRTGMTWEALLQARLFDPLGMASCGFGAPATPGAPKPPDQPWGHRDERRFVPVAPGPSGDNPAAVGPAGTVHCTLADWGKFLAVHLRGARGEPTLLSAETMRTLQTPPAGGDYALGWGVLAREAAGGTVLAHSGSNGTFFVTAWIAPAKSAILVTASNAGGQRAFDATSEAFAPLVERYVR